MRALHDFFSDSTSFDVKEMQSFAQFNYSTALGDSLFGVLIFAKFENHDYRERNELLLACNIQGRHNWFVSDFGSSLV